MQSDLFAHLYVSYITKSIEEHIQILLAEERKNFFCFVSVQESVKKNLRLFDIEI
jgi:hypothetical protein